MEATEADRRGGVGGVIDHLYGIYPAPGYSDVLLISQADTYRNGKLLDGSHWKYPEGEMEVGPSVKDTVAGGLEFPDVRMLLLIHHKVPLDIWRGELVSETRIRIVLGGFHHRVARWIVGKQPRK